MELAMKEHEGCNIAGWLEVQRVAGNFHVSVHSDDFFLLRESQEEMAAAIRARQEQPPGTVAFGRAVSEGLLAILTVNCAAGAASGDRGVRPSGD